jgi:hypothetical protein
MATARVATRLDARKNELELIRAAAQSEKSEGASDSLSVHAERVVELPQNEAG